ncbi:MAG: sulfur carrier protein ThiS [Pseudohongiella sp.]|nr:sulfur carrier protein ThiS [Pseudohongiella sp.]MDO9521113.1 sulfur carrier protein ThiS [Pseudohongiella sp.]MDP2126692.1 sulfur carrier protein ThiS [Pseudohongiella sp.]
MQIQVNGKAVDLPDNSTIIDLLEQLGMTTGRLAVELNTEIVPRSQHASTALKNGDCVEIVHAIGGG